MQVMIIILKRSQSASKSFLKKKEKYLPSKIKNIKIKYKLKNYQKYIMMNLNLKDKKQLE
jgi:hypothetical protein